MKGEELKRALEDLIDKTRLGLVLDALAAVCRDKAEHLSTNWQDDTAAKEWNRAADEVAGVRSKINPVM